MQTIDFQKEELRKKYILVRNEIRNKKEKSKIITDRIKMDKAYKEAKVIALYKSFSSEVDTTELINYSIDMNKTVALPKVVGDELVFYKINSLEDSLVKSEFGVEEPVENDTNLIDKTNIDLVIVPGVCFDREKNRLGFGKGFYDKFLSNTEAKTIAICFNEQILDKQLLPITSNDIKMQQIITDVEILI